MCSREKLEFGILVLSQPNQKLIPDPCRISCVFDGQSWSTFYNGPEVPQSQNLQTISVAQTWFFLFTIGWKWLKSGSKVAFGAFFFTKSTPKPTLDPLLGHFQPMTKNPFWPIFVPHYLFDDFGPCKTSDPLLSTFFLLFCVAHWVIFVLVAGFVVDDDVVGVIVDVVLSMWECFWVCCVCVCLCVFRLCFCFFVFVLFSLFAYLVLVFCCLALEWLCFFLCGFCSGQPFSVLCVYVYIYIYICCEVTNWATFGHFNCY